jgi:thymidylate synthase (FAD)
MRIECLHHGFVRLVSYTQPAPNPYAEKHEAWTGDLEIVRNARVSYSSDWRSGTDEGKDEKLIKYLYKNHHTSPFEAMVFTFEVKAPIFVIRQWMRHRSWSYNEVSARYTELPEEFYVPEKLLKQGTGNKQMSSEEEVQDAQWLRTRMRDHNEDSFSMYRALLDMGVSRELARTVLPLGTYSRFFGTVDLHNLFKFIRLRDHAHAQPEIRCYAQALLELIKPICPYAVEAFDETTRSAQE